MRKTSPAFIPAPITLPSLSYFSSTTKPSTSRYQARLAWMSFTVREAERDWAWKRDSGVTSAPIAGKGRILTVRSA
jgi:hypothetical protein